MMHVWYWYIYLEYMIIQLPVVPVPGTAPRSYELLIRIVSCRLLNKYSKHLYPRCVTVSESAVCYSGTYNR